MKKPKQAANTLVGGLRVLVGLSLGISTFGAAAPEEAREAVRTTLPASLDLVQAQAWAVEHNPTVRRVREELSERLGVRVELRSGGLPKVEANADYTQRDPGLIESFGPDGFQPSDDTWNAGIQINMTVYSAGRLNARLSAEDHRYQAVELRLRTTINDVLLSLEEAWHDGVLAREREAVQDEAMTVLDQQVTWTEHRVEAGSVNRLALLQAKVARDTIRPAKLRAANDYRLVVDRIGRLIGLPYDDGVRERVNLAVVAETDDPIPALDQALARARARRPELAESNRLLEAAYADLEYTKRGSKPTVGVYGGYGLQGTQFSDEDYLQGWNVGLQAKWSLWDGGLTKGRVEQGKSRIGQQALARNGLRSQIEGEVQRAWYDLEVSQEIVGSTKSAIAQAEEALRLAQSRLEAGGATQLDVLQAQLELTRARLERVTAERDVRVSRVRLRHATGVMLP